MKQLQNFFNKYKLPIIWTVSYVAVMWAILYFMFHFNIFNGAQWHHLAHAHLHGFAGFVFGILILAALPLYVATTVIVTRTQEIPVPLPKISLANKKNQKQSNSTDTDESQKESDNTPEISPDVPFEIQSVYIRALKKLDLLQMIPDTQSDTSDDQVDTKNAAPDTTSDIIPLPSDFDISLDDPEPDANTITESIPVFSDVNFDSISDNSAPDTSNTDSINDNDTVITYLTQSGQEFSVQDNIVVTSKYAIASHCDPDFWVTDTDTWFATGKSRPSPTSAVKAVANANNLTPVLYLGSENILDLEKLIPQWESDGIKVITDLDQL